MEPAWIDSLVMLKETEHFKLCYEPAIEPYHSFKEKETYFVIFKPLNQIETAHESYNTACTQLWASEELYEQLRKLFE